jgi:hypothetical protein
MTLVFLKKLGATKTVFAISDDISDYTYGKLFNNTGFAQTVPFLGGKFYCGTNINK